MPSHAYTKLPNVWFSLCKTFNKLIRVPSSVETPVSSFCLSYLAALSVIYFVNISNSFGLTTVLKTGF